MGLASKGDVEEDTGNMAKDFVSLSSFFVPRGTDKEEGSNILTEDCPTREV